MVSRLAITLSAAVLGAALLALPAPAQVRTAGQGINSGVNPAPRGGRIAIGHGGRGRVTIGHGRRGARGRSVRGRRGGYYGGSYYWPPYYYPDGGYVEEAAPQEEPPAPVAYPPQPPPQPAPPVESLLLEYHNGQWVRVPTGAQTPAGPLTPQPDSARAPGARPNAASRQQSARPPAVPRKTVLVFTDGLKEEVSKYVIEGNMLYASVDYWSTGSWTKAIPLYTLNIPATIKLNQKRGVRFRLPSGPNEIMVGF